MTGKILGPRSSTPKGPTSRLLPQVPKFSVKEPPLSKQSRILPPVPPPREGSNVPNKIRSLPRVPRPIQAPLTGQQDTNNFEKNPAIPIVPKHPRQLPKIPVVKSNQKPDDRRAHMFGVYKRDADEYLRKKEYDKALDAYTSALKLVPDEMSTLVAKSRCHQLMGKRKKAMQDVETALSLGPLFHEALFQKAELLFIDGEYDTALVYYNKGNKQRPDIQAFQDGIFKSQDALNKHGSAKTKKKSNVPTESHGNPTKRKRDVQPQLKKKLNTSKESTVPSRNMGTPTTRNVRNNTYTSNTPESKTSTPRNVPTPSFRHRQAQANPLLRMEHLKGSMESLSKPSVASGSEKEMNEGEITERRMKQLLGRMYNDKQYLERLVEQAGELPSGSISLSNMAENGLNFLYDRVLYWVRQGRILPPEAPILPPPPQPKPSKLLDKRTSPRSDTSSGSRPSVDAKSSKSDTRKSEVGVKQPASWFRYLEQKKVAKVSNRKTNNQGRFLTVLEGQKMELIENNENKKSLSPLRPTPPKTEKPTLKRGRKRKGARSSDKENSDTDSGLNISFTTYRGNSDYGENHMSFEDIEPIKEESPSPRKMSSKRLVKYMKKDKKEKQAQRRQQMIHFVNKEIEDIEIAYVDARYIDCSQRAEACLQTITTFDGEPLPNVMSMIGKLHSYIGNSAIENKEFEMALRHHERDLQIGEESDDTEMISRALGNLGRVYVSQGKHQNALELFSRKVPYCATRLETAWLYHEIGNCFLILQQFEFAREAARRSLEAAEEAVEWSYQLQSSVLLGVAEVKLREYHSAFNTFERALDQARMQGDTKAEGAIREALQDVNLRIVEEMKRNQQEFMSRNRADYAKSRAEMSDYSSIYIPEDDGDVSLTETGYDTDNLHLDLDQMRSEMETSMFGSVANLRSERTSRNEMGSMLNLNTIGRSSIVPSAYNILRSNTAMG
ncbi:Hypothetical predicted protein [Mytilus galloprovincialis]|uniref:Outer dynein arm-docking complex subunit 4 n=1 Tax=Mytilus galloprovincialis TaxID=29158 RepID=A0A8B6DF27_MYTGA|nr:Hypothetical predicted protein [Mytilus galloprovincialis]